MGEATVVTAVLQWATGPGQLLSRPAQTAQTAPAVNTTASMEQQARAARAVLLLSALLTGQAGSTPLLTSDPLAPRRHLGSHSLHVGPFGHLSGHTSVLGPSGHLLHGVGPLGHFGSLGHHGPGGSFSHVSSHLGPVGLRPPLGSLGGLHLPALRVSAKSPYDVDEIPYYPSPHNLHPPPLPPPYPPPLGHQPLKLSLLPQPQDPLKELLHNLLHPLQPHKPLLPLPLVHSIPPIPYGLPTPSLASPPSLLKPPLPYGLRSSIVGDPYDYSLPLLHPKPTLGLHNLYKTLNPFGLEKPFIIEIPVAQSLLIPYGLSKPPMGFPYGLHKTAGMPFGIGNPIGLGLQKPPVPFHFQTPPLGVTSGFYGTPLPYGLGRPSPLGVPYGSGRSWLRSSDPLAELRLQELPVRLPGRALAELPLDGRDLQLGAVGAFKPPTPDDGGIFLDANLAPGQWFDAEGQGFVPDSPIARQAGEDGPSARFLPPPLPLLPPLLPILPPPLVNPLHPLNPSSPLNPLHPLNPASPLNPLTHGRFKRSHPQPPESPTEMDQQVSRPSAKRSILDQRSNNKWTIFDLIRTNPGDFNDGIRRVSNENTNKVPTFSISTAPYYEPSKYLNHFHTSMNVGTNNGPSIPQYNIQTGENVKRYHESPDPRQFLTSRGLQDFNDVFHHFDKDQGGVNVGGLSRGLGTGEGGQEWEREGVLPEEGGRRYKRYLAGAPMNSIVGAGGESLIPRGVEPESIGRMSLSELMARRLGVRRRSRNSETITAAEGEVADVAEGGEVEDPPELVKYKKMMTTISHILKVIQRQRELARQRQRIDEACLDLRMSDVGGVDDKDIDEIVEKIRKLTGTPPSHELEVTDVQDTGMAVEKVLGSSPSTPPPAEHAHPGPGSNLPPPPAESPPSPPPTYNYSPPSVPPVFGYPGRGPSAELPWDQPSLDYSGLASMFAGPGVSVTYDLFTPDREPVLTPFGGSVPRYVRQAPLPPLEIHHPPRRDHLFKGSINGHNVLSESVIDRLHAERGLGFPNYPQPHSPFPNYPPPQYAPPGYQSSNPLLTSRPELIAKDLFNTFQNSFQGYLDLTHKMGKDRVDLLRDLFVPKPLFQKLPLPQLPVQLAPLPLPLPLTYG